MHLAKQEIEFIYLHKASLCLNILEQYQNRVKRDVLNSEYYKIFDNIYRVVSMYLRTMRFGLDIQASQQKGSKMCTNIGSTL